ncbi:DNA-processing protein DprA [Cellulosimicrobium protaetiae]|uniref:DNA-protecting protein DprA n=1 Tax=Cellulosimicrobium protaetiae TaxID=2587808 RepID=A0A6M5UGB4_9MICO|nr:DNA-processing protein DprA [Cellulosimicrobium protaetiae]QJW37114.1 DNA-protecting protein DprA [Cellulosimicrobium protaetiae]
MAERPTRPSASRRPVFDVTDDRLARAAWSRIAEPGDDVAVALVEQLGAGPALAWLHEAVDDPAEARRTLVARSETVPTSGPTRGVGLAGPVPEDPSGDGASHDARSRSVARLLRGVARWAPRLDGLDPRRELRVLERLGGTLVVPGDPGWPGALADLGAAVPIALWVRGAPGLAGLAARSVAVVGARACTDYGRHVTGEIASGVAARGFTVVSGGAYGIDAAAHRAALVSGGPTVAFLAGGVDRLYPAGNTDLLRAVVETGGAVVSEVPPGSVPSRVRFLQRNRLIAAFSGATVVVEAAWRSGSLSTATRATELSRPVGAVPGPVTSMASTGCHRLLRDGAAVCVTDADEVAELAGSLTRDAAPGAPPVAGGASRRADYDGLDGVETRAWDALPLRSGAPTDAVARSAGLAVADAMSALGRLEVRGLAERTAGGWRRVRPG